MIKFSRVFPALFHVYSKIVKPFKSLLQEGKSDHKSAKKVFNKYSYLYSFPCFCQFQGTYALWTGNLQ